MKYDKNTKITCNWKDNVYLKVMVAQELNKVLSKLNTTEINGYVRSNVDI